MALTRNQTSHLVRMGAGRRSFGGPVPRHAGHLRSPAPGSCSILCARPWRSWRSPPVWIPQKLSLDAYTSMFGGLGQGGVPVLDYFRNSLIVSITSTVIAIAVGMAGGYAFARYRFKGEVGALPWAHVDANRAGHRAFAAAVHHLCAHWNHRHAPGADPDLTSPSTCLSPSG